MIMFFQKTPVFGKFSFYGCWCFPDGASDILSGYGEPVDNIDKERIQKSDSKFLSKMANFLEINPFNRKIFCRIIDIKLNLDKNGSKLYQKLSILKLYFLYLIKFSYKNISSCWQLN